MTDKKPKHRRDANQLAKSIVDLVTGNVAAQADDGKDQKQRVSAAGAA